MNSIRSRQVQLASRSDVGRVRSANQDVCGEFENAEGYRLFVVADGMGEWDTTTWWHAAGSSLGRGGGRSYPQSLGKFYAAVTQHLGFRPESGEGKTMGLAPFGSDALVAPMRELVVPELRVGEFGFARGRTRMAGPAFERRFGPPRAPDAPAPARAPLRREAAAWAFLRLGA